MKGLILVNAYSTSEEYLYQAKRVKEEFEKKNIYVDIKRNNTFDVYIENNDIYSKYNGFDFIIYWDKDKYILHMLSKIGMPLFNSYQSIINCDDKMTTYIELAKNGIPIPKTLPGLLCYRPDEKINDETVDKLENYLGYPIIAKYSYGSLGNGVFMAKTRRELLEIMEKIKCSPHLFQECIKTSFGKDLRIIVIGDNVVGGMLRESNGDFRSNIGAGGSGKVFELTDDLKKLALKIKDVMKLDYCGIDILFGEAGPVVCEVNSNAFFYTFEKVTKINVAKIYAEYVIEKLKNNK